MNYISLIFPILFTIAALLVFLEKRSTEKEKRSKLYSVPSFVVTIVLIWGQFAFQVYKEGKSQSELEDSMNLLKDNSRTINSLTNKLDESIESNYKLNKQKKIDN